MTLEEIAAYNEAHRRFGNDAHRIAAYMRTREDLTEHADQLYRGPARGYRNRLRVVRGDHCHLDYNH